MSAFNCLSPDLIPVLWWESLPPINDKCLKRVAFSSYVYLLLKTFFSLPSTSLDLFLRDNESVRNIQNLKMNNLLRMN